MGKIKCTNCQFGYSSDNSNSQDPPNADEGCLLFDSIDQTIKKVESKKGKIFYQASNVFTCPAFENGECEDTFTNRKELLFVPRIDLGFHCQEDQDSDCNKCEIDKGLCKMIMNLKSNIRKVVKEEIEKIRKEGYANRIKIE